MHISVFVSTIHFFMKKEEQMKSLFTNHTFNVLSTLCVFYGTTVAMRDGSAPESILCIITGVEIGWVNFLSFRRDLSLQQRLFSSVLMGIGVGGLVWLIGKGLPVIPIFGVIISLAGIMLFLQYREPRYDAKGEISGTFAGILSGASVSLIFSAPWIGWIVGGVVLAVVNYKVQEASRALALEDAM
jgi:hypothetical protein